MGARPPAWDKYEAAILLKGLLDFIRHGTPRNLVVKQVSKDLRKMAQNRGFEVNELFRNVSGVTIRISFGKRTPYKKHGTLRKP